jgi:probable rRNA maturation factor
MDVASPLLFELQIADAHAHNPSESQFQAWLLQAIAQLPKLTPITPLTTMELCIRLVDSEEMQQLNHQFREYDKPTNVLAFPFEALPGWQPDTQLLGDIVICSSVVAKEAAEQNKTIEHHWAHLTLHGFLHLLGYDHIEEADAEVMEALEIKLLANLNIPNPYHFRETTLAN